MTKNMLEEISTKPTSICLWVSIVLMSFFEYIHMLDAEHQGVGSEILGFSRLIQTPERKPTFEKVISMELHCKMNQGTLG